MVVRLNGCTLQEVNSVVDLSFYIMKELVTEAAVVVLEIHRCASEKAQALFNAFI